MADPVASMSRSKLGSATADVLHWPATSPPALVVLFVCGNPGLPHYYLHFLSSISAALPQATVYAIGHLDHSPTTSHLALHSAPAVTLRGQVAHKVEFIDQLDEQYDFSKGKTKLVLIAHSIGAWICCEALKLRPAHISSLQFVFGTISHMRQSNNGRHLAPLFSPLINLPLRLSTAALSMFPTTLIQSVVGVITRQGKEGAVVTSSLVTCPGVVAAAVSMAREEMAQVAELDRQVLIQYGDRMRFYWAKGDEDGWVLNSSVEEISAVLEGAGHSESRRLRCSRGMQHAFILNIDHATSLATQCTKWIKEDVPNII